MTKIFHGTYATARRIVVGFVGATILIVGIALLVLPGPAFVVIPAGLAILAAEFAWARRWLKHVKDGSSRIWETLTGKGNAAEDAQPSANSQP